MRWWLKIFFLIKEKKLFIEIEKYIISGKKLVLLQHKQVHAVHDWFYKFVKPKRLTLLCTKYTTYVFQNIENDAWFLSIVCRLKYNWNQIKYFICI